MTAIPLDPVERARRRRRRRRAVAIVTVASAFLGTTGYFLANTGSANLTITTASGAASNGQVAAVDSSTLTTNVTIGPDRMNKIEGVPITRLVVAKDWVDNSNGQNIRVNVSWTNVTNSPLNGHDQISVGLYYPVSEIASGSCSSGFYVGDSGVQGDTNVSGATGVCVVQDANATGQGVDGSGDLLISPASLSGILIPGTDPTSVSACSADAGQTAWCTPYNVGSSSTRVIYVLAQVVNPSGHAPQGQQPSPGDLTFFVQAKSIP